MGCPHGPDALDAGATESGLEEDYRMESSLIVSAHESSVVTDAARSNSLRARSSQVQSFIRVLAATGLVLISAAVAAAQAENKKIGRSDDPTQLSLDQLMKSE